ncbi:16454_t:CDS:2, partial [Racocetra fulgida]
LQKIVVNQDGHPKSAIWDDFDLGESDGKGYYRAKCEVFEEIRCNWLMQVARRNDKTDIKTSDNESIFSISSKKSITKIS